MAQRPQQFSHLTVRLFEKIDVMNGKLPLSVSSLCFQNVWNVANIPVNKIMTYVMEFTALFKAESHVDMSAENICTSIVFTQIDVQFVIARTLESTLSSNCKALLFKVHPLDGSVMGRYLLPFLAINCPCFA